MNAGLKRIDRSLEVQPQCELDLTVGAEADASLDCRSHRSEGRTTRERQWLAWLELSGSSSKRGAESRWRSSKVRQVENVEDFRTELDITCFGERESPVHDEIDLTELRSSQTISRQISKRPRLRNRKSCRIKERAVIVQVGIDSGNQIRPAGRASRTAVWRIDNCAASRSGGVEDIS